MSLFSFAGSVLFLLFIATFCLFYVAAALSRFSAQIIEFKLYRDAKTQDDNALFTALSDSVKSSDEKLATVVAQFEHSGKVIDQLALQLKELREDYFRLSSTLEARFNSFSKQTTELIEHCNSFQEGLSKFSQDLREDNEKVQQAVHQVQESLGLIRNDTKRYDMDATI